MSSLDRLSIQGIRSFGPNESDTQVIKFYTPLTLILGPNGTGKTTIIESLRYITTGDLPPNSYKTGSFIHDPVFAGAVEVKGRVMLKFNDREGARTTVTRAMQATQKKNKLETRTLDCVIERMAANGEKTQLTQKCAQIEKEMVNFLGVTKPVLINVIFCHQEDSNWPLGEGKTVKEKFDAIFAATRYIKALDNIRTIRKKMAIDIKLFQIDIAYLRQYKDKAVEIKNDLAQTEARNAASKAKIKEIEDEIEPVSRKLEQISSSEGEINLLKIQKGNQETVIKGLEDSNRDILNVIRDLFMGTEENLRQEISKFSLELKTKNTELKESIRKKESVEKESAFIRQKQTSKTQELGKLQSIDDQHKERIQFRNSRVANIAVETKIEGFKDKREYDEAEIADFSSKLTDLFAQSKKDDEKMKNELKKEEKMADSKIGNLNEAKTRFYTTVNLNTKRQLDNKKQIEAINGELKRVDSATGRLKDLESSLAKLETRKSNLESEVDLPVLKTEITELQKTRGELDSKLNLVNQEIDKIHSEAQKKTELDVLAKQQTVKQDSIRKISNRHHDVLKHLLKQIPAENVLQELENTNKKTEQELRVSNKNLNDIKNKLSSLETTRRYHMDEQKKKEALLELHEEKIFQVGGTENFEETMVNLKENLIQLQKEKGAFEGSHYIWSEFINKLREPKACCPICYRGFEDEPDATEIAENLQRKILLIPEQLEAKERHVKDQQDRLDSMFQLRPLQQGIKKLKSEEIPKLKKDIGNVNKQIEEIRRQISQTEEDVDTKQMDIKQFNNIHPDLVVSNQHERDLKVLTRQIDVIKSKMTADMANARSVEEANDEREELRLKLQSTTRSLEGLQQKLADHTEQLNGLNGQINKQNAELLQIMGDQQNRTSLEENKVKLEKENAEFVSSLQEAKLQIDDLNSQIYKAKDEKQKMVEQFESKIKIQLEKVDTEKSSIKELTDLTSQIKNYVNSGAIAKLSDCERDLAQYSANLAQKCVELAEHNQMIERLQSELANQQIKERDLNDNLQLKLNESKIRLARAELEKSKEKLEGFDTNNLFKEKTKLQSKYGQLFKEKERIDGRAQEQNIQILAFKKELSTDQYKNADYKYREKLVELKVNETASEDLNKYYLALDAAINEFHSIKITEINELIKRLWAKTYKGNDIDYIQICCETGETVKDCSKKRTFNYRVVMCSNGNLLDMRGRCSAGQKVLASLIIRLALAETFCINCGVLALDEPTTNLDRENILGLAEALIEIVKSKKNQRKNFQLIVITHDEDFIQLLGRSQEANYYYKVGKTESCYSKITKSVLREII